MPKAVTAGIAAGSHYDPARTNTHKGPRGAGHKGDLPALEADAKGTISRTVTAPRLKSGDIEGRALSRDLTRGEVPEDLPCTDGWEGGATDHPSKAEEDLAQRLADAGL